MKTHTKYRLIRQFFTGAERDLAIVLLASLAATGLNALIPQVFSFAIDEAFSDGGNVFFQRHLWTLSLLVIVIAAGNGFAVFRYRMHTARLGEQFAKNLRDGLFYHVQRLPMSWHGDNQTGDIIQRCTADVEVIRQFVSTQAPEVFRTLFLIAVSLGMMVSMDGVLSLAAVAFLPVIVLYSGIFYHLIAKNFTRADEAEGELSTVVQENATGVRVVRAFGRERFEIERFDVKNETFARMWIRLGTLSGLYWGVGDLITGFQVMLVIALGAVRAVHGDISAGEFVAFVSYNTTLAWPVRGLGRILSEMSKAGVSFERVGYILDSPEEDLSEDGEIPKNLTLSFDHVTFGYEKDREILEDLSFEIPEGTTCGILGATGSGKSTLARLLTRLYDVETGAVSVGGIDVKRIPKTWLRQQIGMVMQEPFLFSRTIRENIAAANPDADMDEIRAAARIACVDETILAFPDGYDTMVGERGVTLSGGQRQRIAIARMLLCRSPILIFDDSFSAVDAQTDLLIRRALQEKMKESTVILISHRVTTLMEADQILVLNHGGVEERGTHEQLIRREGVYRRIYEIQMNQDDRRLLEERAYERTNPQIV